jgi:hypothetical protein
MGGIQAMLYGADGRRVEDAERPRVNRLSHDTISMVAIDSKGNIAAGSSTNGASHKVSRKLWDPLSFLFLRPWLHNTVQALAFFELN